MKRFRDAISLKEAAKFCDCTEDALNVNVRRGKLKAMKVGRNWVTTREWVNEYLRARESKNAAQNKTRFAIIFSTRLENIIRSSFTAAAVAANYRITRNHLRIAAVSCGMGLIFFGIVGAAAGVSLDDFSAAKKYSVSAGGRLVKFSGDLKSHGIDIGASVIQRWPGFYENIDSGVKKFGSDPIGFSIAVFDNANLNPAAVSGSLVGSPEVPFF
jgi:hypothetical protein